MDATADDVPPVGMSTLLTGAAMFAIGFMVTAFIVPTLHSVYRVSTGNQTIDASLKNTVFDSPLSARFIPDMHILHMPKQLANALLGSVHRMSHSTNLKNVTQHLVATVKAKLPDESDAVYGASMRALFFNRFIHPAAIPPEIFEIVPTCSRVTHGPNTCDELTTHSGFDSAAEEPMFVPALAEHACWDINDNTFRCASTYKLYKSTLSTTCPGPRFQVDPVLDTQSQSGDPKILQSGDPKTLIILQIATLLSLVLFLFVRWISSKRSLVRATQQGEQYRQLTMDKNVTVSTIKNFVHAQSSVSPKQISWLRETLCTLVEEVIGQSASSLETDPVVIYRSLINAEETRSGISSGKPIVVTFEDAAVDPHTRAEYIRRKSYQNARMEDSDYTDLQMLRHLTEQFVNAIFGSVRKMPHGIRSIARDFLAATKVKFPDQADELYAAAVGRLLYLRFIHPAIVAPDMFDMVPNTIGAAARRNLAEIAKMLTQISSSSPFQEDTPSLVPLNACITTAVRQLHKWALEVADVPNPEEQFLAHELLDATEQPSSILISPNEVYAMHRLLAQNLEHLTTTTAHSDTVRAIIVELDGAPHLGSDELREASGQPQADNDLSPHTADLQESDPVQLYTAREIAEMEGSEDASSVNDSEEDSPVTLNVSMAEDEDEGDGSHSHHSTERELFEREDSILLFQTFARGFSARRRCAETLSRLDRLGQSITVHQAHGRGCLARRKISEQRRTAKSAEDGLVILLHSQVRGALARARFARYKRELERPSTIKIVTGLQSGARGVLARKRALELSKTLDHVQVNVVWTQAVLRGVLVRRSIRQLLGGLDTFEPSIITFQAIARGVLARRRRRIREEQQATPHVVRSIIGLQARARGLLERRRAAEMSRQIGAVVPSMVGLQAHIRGASVRQRIRRSLAELDSHQDTVVHLQAVARAYLARKHYRNMAKSLRKATPVFVGLQARARAILAQKRAKDVEKALADVQVVHAVSSLQAFARGALTRQRHQEQAKQLEFVAPDVVGMQAQCRGVLARRAFGWWWHYVHEHQAEATHLQALCRGIVVRRQFVQKMNYYRANLSKVVKIQSLFRAKEQRKQYWQLTMGQTPIASSYSDDVSSPFQTPHSPRTTITQGLEDEGDARTPNAADLQDSDPDELYIPRDFARMEGDEQASSLTDSDEDSPVTLNASSMLEDEDESDTPHSHYFVYDSSPEKMDIELPFLDEAETPPTAVNPCKEVDIARGSGEQHSQHLITVQDDLLLTMSSRVKSSSEDMVQQGDVQSIVTQYYNDGEHNNFDSTTAHHTQPDAKSEAAVDTVTQARGPAAQALARPVVRAEPRSSTPPSARPHSQKSFAQQIREKRQQSRHNKGEPPSRANKIPICRPYLERKTCLCEDQGCLAVPWDSILSEAYVPDSAKDNVRMSETKEAKWIRTGRQHIDQPAPELASPSDRPSRGRGKINTSGLKAMVRSNLTANATAPNRPSTGPRSVPHIPPPTPAAQRGSDGSEPQGSGRRSGDGGRGRGSGRGGRR
ncbi:hypothetical protein CALVIDRAFT_600878 [Calocera viscosa TUFC12733]|uniref:Ras-GAP domain-containing protein n=1 Tax=Calocera viscosa (strain TUFC12733) TaxID=1330018 RepID=A0A167J2M7_CALVF|nr:hypothetical protein CALVIDRAFT_600878 [Calocera viscosa TUFC12733]